MKRIILANGVDMPVMGYGTYKVIGADGAVNIAEALAAGYRKLDTASFYGNEEEVGRGILQSGVAREDIFLTTKAWKTELGYENVLQAFESSCRRLQTDYLDLYLLHWPADPATIPDWKQVNAESWRALEELLAAGKVRAIGVSNYLVPQLEALAETAKVLPMVNQLEFHPGWTQKPSVDWCRAHGIAVEAWSPMGRERVFDSPVITALAEKYGCSKGVICLSYDLQKGTVPLPKSSRRERMEENLSALNLTLTEDEMAQIDAIEPLGWSGEDPMHQ